MVAEWLCGVLWRRKWIVILHAPDYGMRGIREVIPTCLSYEMIVRAFQCQDWVSAAHDRVSKQG